MPAPVGERPLTTTQVAQLLRVSASTVVSWANDGRLPYHRTLGGQRRFWRADIAPHIPPDPAEQAS